MKMVVLIGERLDFLMKITNTKNSELGRALNFDASYISRIRAGKRGVPKHQKFVESAAAFFSHRLTEPYQRQIAAETICPGRDWPESRTEAAKTIARWMAQTRQEPEENPVHQFLAGISSPAPGAAPEPGEPLPVPAGPGETFFYYGNAGKRQAVEELLSELCSLGKPQTLMLWSDEDMAWLNEDPAFARSWKALLLRLLQSGSRIRIIHTVSRDRGEMLTAIRKWLPLYMGGAIEPWYCPLPRDGLTRRTLFLARGHSAVLSSSIRNQTRDKLNILLRAPRAVAALEREFEDFLSLCEPLMDIFPAPDNDKGLRRVMAAYRRMLALPGDLILAGRFPSPATMPEAVVGSIGERQGSRWFPLFRNALAGDLDARLRAGGQVTEILNLPPPGTAEPAVPPVCGMLGQPEVPYTRAELAAHLRAVLDIQRREKNYRVILSAAIPYNIIIRALNRGCVAVGRTEAPGVLFCLRESHMISAWWEYLLRLRHAGSPGTQGLKEYIERLKQGGIEA